MDGVTSGQLYKTATVLERGDTSPKVGVDAPNWREVATIHCTYEQVQYIKATIYKGLRIDATAEVRCRFKDWLTPLHRLRIDGIEYSIVNVASDKRANVMQILVKQQSK